MPRTTRGRLYRRGASRSWCLQYYVNGREFRVTLKDRDGSPITDRRKAEDAADLLLAPLRASSREERVRRMSEAMETAEESARRAAEEADRRLAEIRDASLRRGMTFGRCWELFLSSAFARDRGRLPHTWGKAWRSLEEWANGKSPLDISAEDADEFTSGMGLATDTVCKRIRILRRIYSVLSEEGRMPGCNPFSNTRLPRKTGQSKRELSTAQVRDLIESAEGELRTLLMLGYYTGMRLKDCCLLRWDDLDMERGILSHIPFKSRIGGVERETARVKLGLCAELRERLGEGGEGYVLPGMAAMYLKNRGLVTDKVKRHMQSRGIDTLEEGTGRGTGSRAVVRYGFHSLRYSYISGHAEAGTPQAVIQRNAGHQSPAMTEHYIRISDGAALAYAERLSLKGAELRDRIIARVRGMDKDGMEALWRFLEKGSY